jgi:hypothetical protein
LLMLLSKINNVSSKRGLLLSSICLVLANSGLELLVERITT